MRLIKYYDQSIFKQFRKIIPMRAKPQMGTVIEPNIFERSKNPIQRNNPSFTQIDYDSKINVTNFHFNTDTDGNNQEASHSILKIKILKVIYTLVINLKIFIVHVHFIRLI